MAFGRFRKKPVVIDAWQWVFERSALEVEEGQVAGRIPTDGSMEFIANGKPAVPEWLLNAMDLRLLATRRGDRLLYQPHHQESPRITVVTKEGSIYASPGDWIIRGTHNELYPCKPEIFADIYEAVDETMIVEGKGIR